MMPLIQKWEVWVRSSLFPATTAKINQVLYFLFHAGHYAFGREKGGKLTLYSIVQRNAKKKWEAYLIKKCAVGGRFPIYSDMFRCPAGASVAPSGWPGWPGGEGRPRAEEEWRKEERGAYVVLIVFSGFLSQPGVISRRIDL